ncbi:hypothetical protein E2C01_095109 [Portunus trituberculatus]|uniref:Uncharacterized protein n=1 Tax=Portunus trituberculatus TaxID=210409 RepID=A0A5B7JSA1_PORTR|nr:hypothetical protein [Portunus trituberculatus]
MGRVHSINMDGIPQKASVTVTLATTPPDKQISITGRPRPSSHRIATRVLNSATL